MKKTENTEPKKAGRPASPITWPTGKFTVDDAQATAEAKNGTKLCKLQMRNRIQSAIKSGELTALEDTKKENPGVGRPKKLYARTTQVAAWENLRKSRQGKQKAQKTETPEVENPEVENPEVEAPVTEETAEVTA